MNELIRVYTPLDRNIVEEFRSQTFNEGNNSLTTSKFNPDTLNGETFLFFKNDKLASISVIENSINYTNNIDVCRICRYHILKEFRHSNAGFKILPYQVQWAIDNDYKLIFWTHDVNNRALNALYQHTRMMPNKQSYFTDPLYTSFKFYPQYRFVAGDCIQYVYAKLLDQQYVWNPTGKMTQGHA